MGSVSSSPSTSNRRGEFEAKVLRVDNRGLFIAYCVQNVGVTKLRCTGMQVSVHMVSGTPGDINGTLCCFDMGYTQALGVCYQLGLEVLHPLPPFLDQVPSPKETFPLSSLPRLEVLAMWFGFSSFDSVPTFSLALVPFLFFHTCPLPPQCTSSLLRVHLLQEASLESFLCLPPSLSL